WASPRRGAGRQRRSHGPTALRAAEPRRHFFFSSRRRHTRCYRDWSSDVCSSDLPDIQTDDVSKAQEPGAGQTVNNLLVDGDAQEIGRASCRERDAASAEDVELEKDGHVSRRAPFPAQEEDRVGEVGRHKGWTWVF